MQKKLLKYRLYNTILIKFLKRQYTKKRKYNIWNPSGDYRIYSAAVSHRPKYHKNRVVKQSNNYNHYQTYDQYAMS